MRVQTHNTQGTLLLCNRRLCNNMRQLLPDLLLGLELLHQLTSFKHTSQPSYRRRLLILLLLILLLGAADVCCTTAVPMP
jgi:hypothetical protein